MYLETHLPTQSSIYPPIHYPYTYPPTPSIHCQVTHLSIYHPCIHTSSVYRQSPSSICQSIDTLTYQSLHSFIIYISDIHYGLRHLDISSSFHVSTCPSVCSSIHPLIYHTPLPIIYPIFLTSSFYLPTYSNHPHIIYSAIQLPVHPLTTSATQSPYSNYHGK